MYKLSRETNCRSTYLERMRKYGKWNRKLVRGELKMRSLCHSFPYVIEKMQILDKWRKKYRTYEYEREDWEMCERNGGKRGTIMGELKEYWMRVDRMREWWMNYGENEKWKEWRNNLIKGGNFDCCSKTIKNCRL